MAHFRESFFHDHYEHWVVKLLPPFEDEVTHLVYDDLHCLDTGVLGTKPDPEQTVKGMLLSQSSSGSSPQSVPFML